MQLTRSDHAPSVRGRLRAAAVVLLTSVTPALARSEGTATTQIDASALLYGERGRTNVVEPIARVTRLFANGQTVSAQFGFDVITGSSPSGAMPSGRIQTTTTASGNVTTQSAGQIPLSKFQDTRGSLDLEYGRPFGSLVATTTGAHYSREKDYQSVGADTKWSIDLFHRLSTLTLGGGFNHDGIFPIGGVPVGLASGALQAGSGHETKDVASGLVGLSRVLSRRWLVSVNASRMTERGYLTEPYKVVSLISADSGLTVDQIKEKRPDTRDRRSVFASSVYHLATDVLYTDYRYYWDDWGIRSHTIDLRWRHALDEETFLQPHVRFYDQTAADFFGFGLVLGTAMPQYATSDYRLGPLRGLTLGATYGFRVLDYPGDFTVRGEYIRQWGDGYPADAVGIQRKYDLLPPVNIGTLLVGYSIAY